MPPRAVPRIWSHPDDRCLFTAGVGHSHQPDLLELGGEVTNAPSAGQWREPVTCWSSEVGWSCALHGGSDLEVAKGCGRAWCVRPLTWMAASHLEESAPRGHWVMARDICGCHPGGLLTSRQWIQEGCPTHSSPQSPGTLGLRCPGFQDISLERTSQPQMPLVPKLRSHLRNLVLMLFKM